MLQFLRHMIQLIKVSKKFDRHFVIKDLSLTIKKGEIIGLLGPNGAGKTTTIRMITGVLPPTKGKILINNQDLLHHLQEIQQKIGYLPENNPLYPELTVQEYLQFFVELKNLDQNSISEIVKKTSLTEVFYRPISELSKGFRQRVGLAQAILAQPEFLFLDEPTEGLDPNQRRQMHKLITNLGKNKTVIICSHILSEVEKMCQRVIIIDQGQLIADGTPKQLAQKQSQNQILIAEIKGKTVTTTLKKIKNIKIIKKLKTNLYQITAQPEKDLRPDIFKACTKNKWQLLQLTEKESNLEDIFTQLTHA